jgi:outer membrane protein, multidrug efflux system
MKRSSTVKTAIWILSIGMTGVVSFSGCAISKPPAHTNIVDSALPASSLKIPGQWVAGKDSNTVLNNWIASFNDTGLNKIITEAIANNLDLRKAARYVEIEQQNVIVVASKMKLQIGGSAGVSGMVDDGQNGVYVSTKAIGLVGWEPDIWGKLRSETASAQASYTASALDYAWARQSLVALTAKCWYLTIEASLNTAIAEQVVSVYTEMLSLVNAKRELGKVGDLDVAEATANLNAAQGALIQATGIEGEARRNLEEILGRYPSAEIKTALNFSPQPPPVQAGLPSLLLERRPDLNAAEQQVAATFFKEEAIRLSLLPSFSLNVLGGRLGDDLLSLLQLNPWMLASAIGLTVPVYTGGRIPAQIKISTIEQLIAVSNFGIIALRAFKEVENCLMYENLLVQRYQIELLVLNDRTEALRIAKLKYEAGSIDLLSVLQLQNAEIASQHELIKLRYEQLANLITLHLALGGSFD